MYIGRRQFISSGGIRILFLPVHLSVIVVVTGAIAYQYGSEAATSKARSAQATSVGALAFLTIQGLSFNFSTFHVISHELLHCKSHNS